MIKEMPKRVIILSEEEGLGAQANGVRQEWKNETKQILLVNKKHSYA